MKRGERAIAVDSALSRPMMMAADDQSLGVVALIRVDVARRYRF